MTAIKFLVRNLRRIVYAVVALLLIFLILALFFDPIKTIYNTTAQTEIVEYTTTDRNHSRFSLFKAEVFDYDGNLLLKDFEGSFEINEGVKLIIERIAHGPLIIDAIASSTKSVGDFYNGADGSLSQKGTAHATIVISDIDSLLQHGISHVFPISGKVELGRPIDFEIFGETTAVLKSGNIIMTGYSSLGNNYFEAGSESLYLGDYLVFEGTDENAFGFLTINEEPGLQTSYRVESVEARVRKPGPKNSNSGYPISASLYDKFINDRLFQAISLLFGGILFLTTIITFIIDLLQFKNSFSKK